MGGKDWTFVASPGHWRPATPTGGLGQPETTGAQTALAAGGAWIAGTQFELKTVSFRTPFSTTYTLDFSADGVVVSSRDRLGAGPRTPRILQGKSE